MKNAVAVFAVLLAGAMPALAEDGRVSGTTLSALGLDGMEVVSDADGMEVRGMSSSATAKSWSRVP